MIDEDETDATSTTKLAYAKAPLEEKNRNYSSVLDWRNNDLRSKTHVRTYSGYISPRRCSAKRVSGYATRLSKATKRVIAPYVNIIRKGQAAVLEPMKDNEYYKFYLKKRPGVLDRDIKQFLDNTVDLTSLLNESLDTLKAVTKAAGGRVYLVDLSANEIYINPRHSEKSRRSTSWKITEYNTIAAQVALTHDSVLVYDVIGDPNYKDPVPYLDATMKSVLAVPILTHPEECFAVIELYRDVMQPAFQSSDLKAALTLANWMGTAIYMNQQSVNLSRQTRLDDCLIDLTKCYMSERILFDKMIFETLRFAKMTVNAERVSFFILDKVAEDMVADIFDEGTENHQHYGNKRTNIRFSKDRGIAGHVFQTGKGVNVRDAYNDPRFLKEIDDKTGFITRAILCMPVLGLDGVMGVIQAINKAGGLCFTKADEDIFKTFSIYCSLALHYSRAFRNLQKDDLKYTDTIGILKRHCILPCDHDLQDLLRNTKFYGEVGSIRQFKWYISPDHLDDMPRIILFMIKDIAKDEVDTEELAKFILAVKNFYRRIDYHNWEHGFTVCTAMYNILHRNADKFTNIEKKALMIATLSHDIDHGGVTNQFLFFSNDPLAQLYEESTWECHHYYVTMLMLEEIHVYKDISEEEFRQVSKVIRDAIIATDLANYFKVRNKLLAELNNETYDFNDPDHRYMTQCVVMNVCDLSAQCKPFPVAKRVTEILYKEFYLQGDREREMGRNVLSLFDRYQPNKVAGDQVQFLTVLVMPCADLVRRCFPNTGRLYKLAAKLRLIWMNAVEVQDEKCWRQDDSVVPELRNKVSFYY